MIAQTMSGVQATPIKKLHECKTFKSEDRSKLNGDLFMREHTNPPDRVAIINNAVSFVPSNSVTDRPHKVLL